LTLGASLELCREPKNEHDACAILVQDKSGNKLGYIPRDANNELIANLIDAGKYLYATVSGINSYDNCAMTLGFTDDNNTGSPVVGKYKKTFSIDIKIFMDESRQKKTKKGK